MTDALARQGTALLMAGLLFPGLLLAEGDILAVGRCQGLAPEQRAAVAALDQSLTGPAAARAAAEVERRLGAALTAPAARGPAPRALAVTLEGWMVKKAWLSARARREHDADEAADYCEFLRREALGAL